MNEIKLDTHPKINPGFEIPESYFETFSDRLMLKMPQKEVKVISFYAQHKNWIYTVVASLIIVFSIPVMNLFQKADNAINANEIENYLTTSSQLSDDEIINLMNDDEIANIKVTTPVDSKVAEEILSQNSNIEEYITD
ncbi:MAG: hypothetical protein H7239_06730 [Flavobacterium sp.]|nr:hypothetical protein [Flavobacterium sp.]